MDTSVKATLLERGWSFTGLLGASAS